MCNKKMSEDEVWLNIRITRTMRRLLERAVTTDTHMNASEFARDAIRKELARRGLLEREVLETAQ